MEEDGNESKPKGILSSSPEANSPAPANDASTLAKFKGQVKALKFAHDMARKVEQRRADKAGNGEEGEGGELGPGDQADASKEGGEVGFTGMRRLSTSNKQPMTALELAKRRAEIEEKADEDEMLNYFTMAKKYEFKPKPLHVRSLCLQARRACERELQREAPRLKAAEALFSDLRDSSSEVLTGKSNKVAVVHTDCLTEEEQEDLEVTVKRLRYTVGLLDRRKQRLAKLDWTTFQQLPDQLVEAAGEGDLEYVKLCADAGVPLDVYNKRGVTPLTAATVSNKVTTACLLLERKADPSMQDINGACAVHYAIELQRYQVFDAALIAMNQSRNWVALYLKDSRGKTVLDYARMPGREESIRLLKLRLGGPLGLLWAVATMTMHNSVLQAPEGHKNQKQITKMAAKMAAQRHGDLAATRQQAAKDKAREKLLGGALCSFCSIAQISEKKMQELIHHEVPEDDALGGIFDDIDHVAAQKEMQTLILALTT